MAYLPLILLLMAALFSGFTVLSVVIANRSRREEQNTIFPIVREMEGIRARWARIFAISLSTVSALSIGGWVATQSDIFLPSMPALSVNVVQGSVALVEAITSREPDRTAPPSEIVARIPSPEATATAVALTQALDNLPPSTNIAADIATDEQGVPPDVSNEPASPYSKSSVAPVPAIAPISPAVIEAETVSEPLPLARIESSEKPEQEVVKQESVEPVPETTERFVPTGRGGLTRPPDLPDNINDINIGPIVFTTNVTDRRLAVEPSDIFNAGESRIYAVFPYEGMQNGLQFSVIWYHQGKEISREDTSWTWGTTDSSFAYFTPAGAGKYEVEMKVNSETLASAGFEVLP